MRVVVWGANGHMGKLVVEELKQQGHQVVGTVDIGKQQVEPADVIVDFSSPDGLEDLLEYALETKTPIVIATTGHSPEQQRLIDEACGSVPVLQASNMSIGMNILFKIVAEVASVLMDADIEIVETHHHRKKDAPSGSAVSLVQVIEDVVGERVKAMGRSGLAPRQPGEIGVHAIRGGNIVGQHEVHFFAPAETVTLSHTAYDRRIFAAGAVKAAEFLVDKPAGRYSMKDVLQPDGQPERTEVVAVPSPS